MTFQTKDLSSAQSNLVSKWDFLSDSVKKKKKKLLAKPNKTE